MIQRARTPEPTLEWENCLWQDGYRAVAGIDEVGRGALAGPVTVGVVVVRADHSEPPAGIKDSKLLSPSRREQLVPLICQWARAWGVGDATSVEVDRVGIVGALRLAAYRALEHANTEVDMIILDGTHNWLAPDLLTVSVPEYQVVTGMKADQRAVSVAAASVLAKVHRDRHMRMLHHDFPQYGWDSNKGYASALHQKALGQHGASPHHRVSWKLPGISESQHPSRISRRAEAR